MEGSTGYFGNVVSPDNLPGFALHLHGEVSPGLSPGPHLQYEELIHNSLC